MFYVIKSARGVDIVQGRRNIAPGERIIRSFNNYGEAESLVNEIDWQREQRRQFLATL